MQAKTVIRLVILLARVASTDESLEWRNGQALLDQSRCSNSKRLTTNEVSGGDEQCGALFRSRSQSEIIFEANAEEKYPEWMRKVEPSSYGKDMCLDFCYSHFVYLLVHSYLPSRSHMLSPKNQWLLVFRN